MAEEGTLGVGRASDQEVEPGKEELQRRMEEARHEITQAVTEIKETVTNQYYSMKESVSDALDWRHHFRKNPIAFSVGALGLGFLVGYGVAGSFKGNGRSSSREDYPSHDETDVYARTGATPPKFEEDSPERHSAFHGHSYAAQAIIGAPRESAAEREGEQSSEAVGESREGAARRGGDYTYSSPRQQSEEECKPGENKPSLFDRFKETSAYERLETEVASLGDRFIDELSKTAQNVVLPALFNKIKELFGVDLSNKQEGRQAQSSSSSSQTGQAPQTASTGAQTPNAQAASASASLATASRGGASSYATSENSPYSAQSRTSDAGRRQDDSVLDLEEQG